MNDINPLLNFFLRIKRWIKEDITNLKNKIKDNEILKRFKNNWKRNVLIIILVIIFIVCFILFLNKMQENHNFNKLLIGPETTETIVIENKNQKISYDGSISNGKINGLGELKIETQNYIMTLNGQFEENTDESINTDISIGIFKEGTIYIEDLNNNSNYKWEGTFNNYVLTKGTITINKDNKQIIYSGNFENNLLQGIGSKKLIEDGKTIEISGWFEDGQLKETTTIENSNTEDSTTNNLTYNNNENNNDSIEEPIQNNESSINQPIDENQNEQTDNNEVSSDDISSLIESDDIDNSLLPYEYFE